MKTAFFNDVTIASSLRCVVQVLIGHFTIFQSHGLSGWFVPKIMKRCLNLPNLRPKYSRSLFFWTRCSHIVYRFRVIWHSKYRELEIQVRGHWRSLEMAPFDRLHMDCYSSFMVTITVSYSVGEMLHYRVSCWTRNERCTIYNASDDRKVNRPRK